MTRDLASGICAGLVSALMVLSAISGSAAGALSASLAALPVSLITFRNGALAGLIASLCATATVSAIPGFPHHALAFVSLIALPATHGELVFASLVALPAWALPFLALPAARGKSRTEVPIGSIAAVAALLCACSIYLAFFSSGRSYGDVVRQFEDHISNFFRDALQIPKGQPVAIPNFDNSTQLIHILSSMMLPMIALTFTIMNLVGLWLAARIARHWQFLPRKWPDIASLRLPVWMIGCLGLSCMVALVPGDVSLVGKITLASILGVFILQGLAVVHFNTRGNDLRPLLLGGLYLLCFVAGTLALSIIILIALVDTFIDLRRNNKSSTGTGQP